jgi:transposase
VRSARLAGACHPPPASVNTGGTAITTIAHTQPARLTVGVDTHKDVHVACAKDQLGRRLATTLVPTTTAGYAELLRWAGTLGQVEAFGIEGTGCYGAELVRFLHAHGQRVLEVNRPDRAARRRHGKSDPVDAEAAARAVQADEATGLPKAGDGTVEMLRVLRVARRTAMRARTQTINALKSLVVTAPDPLRQQLRDLPTRRLVTTAAAFQPGTPATPATATMLALGILARRYQALDGEITMLGRQLHRLVGQAAPALLEVFGVGPETASALLVAAGDNPQRLHSDAAFAALCGVSPVEMSSGKTVRHRLNQGGDRQANNALWRIVIVRLRAGHPPTVAYLQRRTAQGKSKREVIRCLKRYAAREVFAVLQTMAEQAIATAA